MIFGLGEVTLTGPPENSLCFSGISSQDYFRVWNLSYISFAVFSIISILYVLLVGFALG